MNSTTTETRRTAPRAKIASNEIVYLNFQTGNGAIVLDVSPDGLGFQAADALDPNESLSFRLSVPACPDINLSGRVAWLDSSRKRGGLHLNLSAESQMQFVEWQRKYVAPPQPDADPVPPSEPVPAPAPVAATATAASASVAASDASRAGIPVPPPVPAAPPAPSVPHGEARTAAPPPNPFLRRPDPMLGSRGPIFVSEWEPPPEESHLGRNVLVVGVILALCAVIVGGSYYLAGKREMGNWLIHLGQSVSGAPPQSNAPPAGGQTVNSRPQTAAPSATAAARQPLPPPSPAVADQSAPVSDPTGNAPQLTSPELSQQLPNGTATIKPSAMAGAAPPAATSALDSVPPPQSDISGAAPSSSSSSLAGAAPALPDLPAHPNSQRARSSSVAHHSPATADNGEDFAEAQKYLASGNPQDSAVAVELLWSAIGNGNTQAELVLGDLYLRGQGAVHQNCRQAEVLLRAALAANVPGALEKIQKLQTYGCR